MQENRSDLELHHLNLSYSHPTKYVALNVVALKVHLGFEAVGEDEEAPAAAVAVVAVVAAAAAVTTMPAVADDDEQQRIAGMQPAAAAEYFPRN